MITCGLLMDSSYPSRRMFSIRMPRCSRPRPETLNASLFAVSSTFSATLLSSSLKSRSRRFRLVTYLPSLPTNGESFTLNIIVSVGGSISVASSGCGLIGIADAVADVDGFQPDQRDDIAGLGCLRRSCGPGRRRPAPAAPCS